MAEVRSKLQLRFRHGLGDAIQLQIVLRHLRRHIGFQEINVQCLYGKHSAVRHLCNNLEILETDDALRHVAGDQTIDLVWNECIRPFNHVPSTKPAQCLVDVFRLIPDPSLFYYDLPVSELSDRRVEEYLCGVSQCDALGFRAVGVHYEGNTDCDRKNLRHDEAAAIVEAIISAGFTPIVFDWDARSPLPDEQWIFCPRRDNLLWGGRGTGDAETLAALISQLRIFVGIDSGPLHVAGATRTRSVAIWTYHHPAQYFDLAGNVMHCVPNRITEMAIHPEVDAYFRKTYCWQEYQSVGVDIPAFVADLLLALQRI